ncbi:MAG: M1 family peptidase [Bacteroidetes bacterium]|jgi:hypothetical protein|nr:M1 family peptidase [Bacteroidota bacterium]
MSHRFFCLLLLCIPLTLISQTRTAIGLPGPDYWQNRADYDITATLDTANHLVSGIVQVTYTNNSPYTLPYLWLQLEQNKYRPDSRGEAVSPAGSRHDGSLTPGMQVGGITVDGQPVQDVQDDTRLQLRLKLPLAPGKQVEIAMNYTFTVPEEGADRMGRMPSEQGWIYEIAQWYPRMAVLDDVTGWNNLPYLGPGEFYCEYGDFEYTVTVPAGFVVAGSGTLQNPKEVLGRDLARRLDNAVESDTAQFIIAPEEIGQALPASEETVTWRYQMDNTRDVAWACSPAFAWDAAGAKRPDGSRILVQSFYPIESYEGWHQATAYAKSSLEHYSEQWFPYPYSSLSNVAGGVGGMEYPGLHFTGYSKKGNSLWVTLDHEVAHNWFPMIVGSNEREHAWMDESFVTFMGYYAAEAYTGDDFNSYISNPQMMMRRFMEAGLDPVMTPPRRVQEGFSDVVYFKPAIALYLLREYVLGKERFDYAFRTYIEHWAYKHPQPEDFFRAMENGSGEQLDWFWQGWFYESGDLDQSISSASQSDQGRLRIDLENRLGMPMPAVLDITYEDGSTETRRFPVDIWANAGRFSTRLQLDKPVAELRLDPDGMLPDVEPRNNVWRF